MRVRPPARLSRRICFEGGPEVLKTYFLPADVHLNRNVSCSRKWRRHFRPQSGVERPNYAGYRPDLMADPHELRPVCDDEVLMPCRESEALHPRGGPRKREDMDGTNLLTFPRLEPKTSLHALDTDTLTPAGDRTGPIVELRRQVAGSAAKFPYVIGEVVLPLEVHERQLSGGLVEDRGIVVGDDAIFERSTAWLRKSVTDSALIISASTVGAHSLPGFVATVSLARDQLTRGI